MLKDNSGSFSNQIDLNFNDNLSLETKKPIQEIAVIDGHSLIFRYALGMPEFFSPEGIQVNGLFGFCSLLLKMIKQNNFKTIIIAFDKCRNNFRKEILSTYKANRTKDMSHVMLQIELAIEFCKFANITYHTHDQYEADDIIATYVHQNTDFNFTVLSLDKDLLQLLDKQERIKIYNPFTKQNIKYNDVYKKYSIYPDDFALFLALCGDSSDNIPGIRGVGPKTAVKIIDSGIGRAQELFGKYDFSELDKMLSLTKLFLNVPIDFTISDKSYNYENIRHFLKVMAFDALAKF